MVTLSPEAAVSGNQILLRAERAGTGNGRVYVVHFTATDVQGGSCSGSVKVTVPHSKKNTAGEEPATLQLVRAVKHPNREGLRIYRISSLFHVRENR